jgi:hypothetical protein
MRGGTMADDDKMQQMDAWIDLVCGALGMDRETVRRVEPALLDMVAEVAHKASRPGGPITSFLVGYRAGQQGGAMPEAVDAQIAKVLAVIPEQ